MADVEMTHPAHRSVHAVRNAIQILIGFQERHALQALQMDAADVRRLLEDVPADIAALYQNNERLEDDLRGLRDQGLEDAREITELRRELADERRKLAAANREVEQLLQGAYDRLDVENDHFNRIRSLRDTLHEGTYVGEGFIIIGAQHAAAAGGQ